MDRRSFLLSGTALVASASASAKTADVAASEGRLACECPETFYRENIPDEEYAQLMRKVCAEFPQRAEMELLQDRQYIHCWHRGRVIDGLWTAFHFPRHLMLEGTNLEDWFVDAIDKPIPEVVAHWRWPDRHFIPQPRTSRGTVHHWYVFWSSGLYEICGTLPLERRLALVEREAYNLARQPLVEWLRRQVYTYNRPNRFDGFSDRAEAVRFVLARHHLADAYDLYEKLG